MSTTCGELEERVSRSVGCPPLELFINTTLHGLMTLFDISAFLLIIEDRLRSARPLRVVCRVYLYGSSSQAQAAPQAPFNSDWIRMTIEKLEVLEKSRQFDFQSRNAFS